MQTKITNFFLPKSTHNNVSTPISLTTSNLNIQFPINKPQDKSITIYTDGACSNNGKKNAAAGIGVYVENIYNISEKISGRQTNQRAELYAILKALNVININDYTKIIIYTDSLYSINCITKWIKTWIKNGWLDKKKHPIKNKDIIQSIYNIYNKYNHIHFIHVLAHTNNTDIHSIGNSKADALANLMSQMYINPI